MKTLSKIASWVVAAVLAAAVWVMCRCVVLTWRAITGQMMNGVRRTDASFFRAGIKRDAGLKPIRRWSFRPGYQRALLRVIPAVLGAGLAWAAMAGRTWVLAGYVAGIAAGLAWCGHWAYRRSQQWQMRRKFILPTHYMLTALLSLPPTLRPEEYIQVPASFRTNEKTPVRIVLPRTFSPSAKNNQAVIESVLPKLGCNQDNTDSWIEAVGQPVLYAKMAPQPPKMVLWADVTAHLDACKTGEIFVGLGARNAPYFHNFTEGDDPHGGFNGQTGSGKSVAVMAWVAQFLHQDAKAMVTFIDPKRSALPQCLVGVPQYRLANDMKNVEEMFEAIADFHEEMMERQEARFSDPTLEFSRMVLVLDELSVFADVVSQWWENNKDWWWEENKPERSSNKPPKRAPVWVHIADLLRMGREFGVNVLAFSQRFDHAASGGFGLRDLFGWRGLSNFRPNAWKMLIGTTPIPKSVNLRGRWIYDDGSSQKWVQNVLATPQELRDWALNHEPHADDSPAYEAIKALPGSGLLVGNEAAAEYLGIPVNTFLTRKKRAGLIPYQRQGKSPVYRQSQLDSLAPQEAVQ